MIKKIGGTQQGCPSYSNEHLERKEKKKKKIALAGTSIISEDGKKKGNLCLFLLSHNAGKLCPSLPPAPSHKNLFSLAYFFFEVGARLSNVSTRCFR